MAKRGPKPQFEQVDLLNTAMEIVNREGFSALSMSSLARHLGTSVSALYRYVDSREALFALLQVKAIGLYRDGLSARLEQLDVQLSKSRVSRKVKALARVFASFSYFLDFPDKHPSAYRLIDAFISTVDPLMDDEHARQVDAALQVIIQVCAGTLKEADADGALAAGEAVQRTHLVWAAMHGISHFKKRDRIQPDNLKVGVLKKELLSLLVMGCGATPSDVHKAWALLG
jgi:AcrR family transcriptional regulator